MVIGLGRSVTFLPTAGNSAEKYKHFFEAFGLYPEDRCFYYWGAGFSLSFSSSDPFRQSQSFFAELDFDPEVFPHLLAGSKEAMILKEQVSVHAASTDYGDPLRTDPCFAN